MPYYNYNNPNPYDSNIFYDGFYSIATTTVTGGTLVATGLTPSVKVVNPVYGYTSIASARTLAGNIVTQRIVTVSGGILPATGITHPVGFKSNVFIGASVSMAFARTWPIANAQETQVERIRLYDGFPRPQDVALARNRKVTVVGGKLAYQLTGKFWTTKL